MDEIIAALEAIEAKGSFCTQIQLPCKDIDIKINKLGILSNPISESQIQELISKAKPAKFGWKDQTILDENVRKTWEIKKNHINIPAKQWKKTFEPLLEKFKAQLGLPRNSKLKAELHNMLIYEPGCFFKTHQDSEKTNGMVASMVVILPTEYEGGDLIIHHKGETQSFTSSFSKVPKLSCIAFYADCHHEITKLISGYRVALTYNLILEGYNGDFQAIFEENFDKRLGLALQNYFIPSRSLNQTAHETVPKLVYLLDHQYTQAGLSWNSLKNLDHDRVTAILSFTDNLGLDAFLAIADVRECWECEYDKYHRSSDYDEENHPETSYILLTEITLDHLIDIKGNPFELSNFTPRSSEICWTGGNENFDPYESEYEGWMGNYGNTVDRWYKRAAIVLWKKQDHYAILFEADPKGFMDKVFSLMESEDGTDELKTMLKFATPYWKSYALNHKVPKDIIKIFELSFFINDGNISHNLLSAYEIQIFNFDNINSWKKLISLYGCDWCINLLRALTEKSQQWKRYTDPIGKFDKIISEFNSIQNVTSLIDWLLTYQAEVLQDVHKKENKAKLLYAQGGEKRVQEMTSYMEALISSGNQQRFIHTLRIIIDQPERYPHLELINLYETCCIYELGENWHLKDLNDHILSALKTEHEKGLRRQDDWAILENSHCSCPNCTELNAYLHASNQKEKKWPLVEVERIHIREQISKLHIPFTINEERSSRPYKLILIKSDTIYEKAKERYFTIEKILKDLQNKNG